MEAHSEDLVLTDPPLPFLMAVTVNDLPTLGELVAPLLVRACQESRGEFTIPGILHNMGLHDGVERWRLLAIVRAGVVQAVMVVCITARGDGSRVLDCLLAAGDHAKDWPLVDDEFDAYARDYGCTKVRIPHARKGWQRTLPHWDWTGIVLERAV